MKDKNGNEIKVGDMVRFKEDRYTQALGVIEELIPEDDLPARLWVKICEEGRTRNRLVLCHNAELITNLA